MINPDKKKMTLRGASVRNLVCCLLICQGFSGCQYINPLAVVEQYTPSIWFRGYYGQVGQYEVFLPGNLYYPNTARIRSDTIDMYFFSSDYVEGGKGVTWRGDQLRVQLFFSRDSLDTAYNTKSSFVKLTRYLSEGATYLVNPGDSDTEFSAKITMPICELRSGGAIRISDLFAQCRGISNISGNMAISKGKIEGTFN